MTDKLWLEAADFDDFGGWHLDTQYIHKMGSPCLLAPYFEAKPALDAKTTVRIPQEGTYTLWVRARNWIKGHAPGQFKVYLDNQTSPTIFGKAESDQWIWEKGGTFELKEGNCQIRLNDLTGYFSRFNALILTTDSTYIPPSEIEKIRSERMACLNRPIQPQPRGNFDFVVVGGGPGGFPAALQAARMGMKTLLIHDRPVLGGNASSEIEVPFDGANSRQLYARETGICEELFWLRRNTGRSYDDIFTELAGQTPQLTVILNQRVLAAETKENRIISITARDVLTSVDYHYGGRFFLDGTGDGHLGAFAGADFMFGREASSDFDETMAPDKADDMTMSGCLRGPFGPERIIKRDKPIPYHTPEWVEPFGPEFEEYRSIPGVSAFHWWLEHSNELDDVAYPEECRDELIKIYLAYWDYMKNRWSRKEESTHYELNYIPFINGRREGRRLVGDYVLKEEDCRTGKSFEDNIAYAGWPIDIHHPKGIYSGKEGPFFSNMDVPLVKIPYRCLYSKNITNLFMAGRNVSVTHIALGTVRVEATCAIMGQAAGIAAVLCQKYRTTPRGIYENHIEELQQLCLKNDLYIPEVKNKDTADLALTATTSASSENKWELFSREKGWPNGWPQLSDCKRALFFPLEVTQRVDNLYIKLRNESKDSRELTMHVYESDAPGVFAVNSKIGDTKGLINGNSESWVEFPINRDFDMKYAWVYLDEADDVFIQRMVSGKLDTYLAWTHDLQHPGKEEWHIPPRHQYYAYSLEKPVREFASGSSANVNNGWGRALDPEHYMWISEPNNSFPQYLDLTWQEEIIFNTVYLTFDTDLNNPAMNGKSSTKMSTFCVSDYELQAWNSSCDKWKTICSIRDNYFRRRIHSLSRIETEKLRLKVLNTIGSYSARVYEIRVYNE
jgi:hypothetical protein